MPARKQQQPQRKNSEQEVVVVAAKAVTQKAQNSEQQEPAIVHAYSCERTGASDSRSLMLESRNTGRRNDIIGNLRKLSNWPATYAHQRVTSQDSS